MFSIVGPHPFLTDIMSFQECSNIFSKGGGEELAELTGSEFLGEINGSELHVILAHNHKVSQHTVIARHSSFRRHFTSLPCC